MHYLLLQHPGHNRVYYESAAKMALAELQLACRLLQSPHSEPFLVDLEGIPYLALPTEAPLSEEDLALLSGRSFAFALYASTDPLPDPSAFGGSEGSQEGASLPPALRPQRLDYRPWLDHKISSLLKYPGKTNEHFTRMMIAVAELSAAHFPGEMRCLLDPVAGKGTTLFEGLARGFHVYGIEQDKKALHECEVFFRQYLDREGLKHRSDRRRISGAGKKDAVFIREYEVARSRDEFKEEDGRRRLGLVTGDTRRTAAYFKRQKFHYLVGDLPYGIAHASKGKQKQSRNPGQLLEESIPAWYQVLHPGGCLVMAWNSHLMEHRDLAALFGAGGFEVKLGGPYANFEHRVDRAIKRNILVALKAAT